MPIEPQTMLLSKLGYMFYNSLSHIFGTMILSHCACYCTLKVSGRHIHNLCKQ